MSVFVYADAADYGDVASYLLAIADERGFDRKLIRTTFQGFEVPEGMLLEGEYEGSVPAGVKDVTADAPDWFFSEPREVDVESDDEGNIYLKEDVAHALAEEFDTTVEEINKQFDLDELESKEEPKISAAQAEENAKSDAHNDALRAQGVETTGGRWEGTPDLVQDEEEDHEPDREEIREWAKENGYKVADVGALKKSVIAAYSEAHQA